MCSDIQTSMCSTISVHEHSHRLSSEVGARNTGLMMYPLRQMGDNVGKEQGPRRVSWVPESGRESIFFFFFFLN